MNKFILALDQGTTSSRAILFDIEGKPVAMARKELRQIYPGPGHVEHDPDEIWSSQAGVAMEAIARAGVGIQSVAAIGITNQRETTIIWNRRTGRPVYNAIVWQDRRTAGLCDDLKRNGYEEMIREKTGLPVDAYFSATKIQWILKNIKDAGKMAENGELAFGTVDSWLAWNLTRGKSHITDVSNASRTMLFNIHTLEWDKELLELFGIPAPLLPEVRPSSHMYGVSDGLFMTGIPLAGIAGDQQASLFGHMCTEPGMVKNTYGTGCFMMMNTGHIPVSSGNRLLTTVAWQTGDGICYALEGSIFIGGAVVQWLRDQLGVISESADVEKLAAEVSDSGGVYFVPAFAGLGAPHWNQYAAGTITGLTRGTSKAHIARAALESIAFQTCDVLRAMQDDSGTRISELKVDGGASVNNLLMQFQSDLLGTAVVRPRLTETTALGAAYFAGLATGFWSCRDEIREQWQTERRFVPEMPRSGAEILIRGWDRAVKAVISLAGDQTS